MLLLFDLLSNIADSRFMGYLPSVLATATVMRVVNTVEPRLGVEYQDQLLGILGIDKVVRVFLNQCVVLIKSWKRSCLNFSCLNSQRHNSIDMLLNSFIVGPSKI